MTEQDAIRRSLDDLQDHMGRHRRLVAGLLSGNAAGDGPLDCPHDAACPHERRLKRTLLEAIHVLEESRKAFKSKRLETLRRKLIGVLAEEA